MTASVPPDHQTAPERLEKIRTEVAGALRDCGRGSEAVEIIAVSKTFPPSAIAPLLEAGHRVFGENRVQEAGEKWPALKAAFPDAALHLIGPLQSNKAAQAVALFDVIHSLDRMKLARVISEEMTRQNRKPRLFVQVNTGNEAQKSGVAPEKAAAFVQDCRQTCGLEIDGLMCLPPQRDVAGPHFALLQKLAGQCGVSGLSMGMSADFADAVKFGATHIRLGTAVFGPRIQAQAP